MAEISFSVAFAPSALAGTTERTLPTYRGGKNASPTFLIIRFRTEQKNHQRKMHLIV